VTSNWAVAAIIVSALTLIAAALCIVMMRLSERRAIERQRVLEEQVGGVDEALQMIEARLTELHSAWAEPQQSQEVPAAATSDDAVPGQGEDPAIELEIQAAIAAAAIAAAGPNARVRSATLAKSRDKASPWSQQGRVLVQSSHNLRQ
jgi:hypothetical protein